MNDQPELRPVEERGSDGRIRDRHVVLVAVAIVATVLGLRLLGELVPGVDQALGAAPLLIVALVAITAVVLIRALRPRREGLD